MTEKNEQWIQDIKDRVNVALEKITPIAMKLSSEELEYMSSLLEGQANKIKEAQAESAQLRGEKAVLEQELEMMKSPCICSEYDGKGYSTCGGICPQHYPVVIEELKKKIRLYQAINSKPMTEVEAEKIITSQSLLIESLQKELKMLQSIDPSILHRQLNILFGSDILTDLIEYSEQHKKQDLLIEKLRSALEPFAEEGKRRRELQYKLERDPFDPLGLQEKEKKYNNFCKDSEKYWKAQEVLIPQKEKE